MLEVTSHKPFPASVASTPIRADSGLFTTGLSTLALTLITDKEPRSGIWFHSLSPACDVRLQACAQCPWRHIPLHYAVWVLFFTKHLLEFGCQGLLPPTGLYDMSKSLLSKLHGLSSLGQQTFYITITSPLGKHSPFEGPMSIEPESHCCVDYAGSTELIQGAKQCFLALAQALPVLW